ncbi:hypothetical protein PV10_07002 [Exophiala mesophila]|uniref:Uncharacterized protein n=1 Tax=Exophiala mesophila TaxID=212818 RepID=A0A0D1XNC3_EXOME|nr:uncharacterized protein PV10_07002 [Exophiala mesophila]KIV89616.1 hypothetical protein PV10_07002 [Exophiala mesophila]
MSSEQDVSQKEDSSECLRSRILGCLDGIHGAGSFATSDHNAEHVHPGLVVKNVGLIRLPLSPEDAKALIRVSRQAPAGEGGETLVDETVTKTWEIDAEELSFENEDWTNWLDRVLEYVSEDLGIPDDAGRIQAELDKLLVYEESAFFKHHKDTEKTNNAFGTLVICLPSEHVGGGVRLIHGDEERVLESDKWSSYGVSYLAWYNDVSHEVLPIQSGYRCVLTYNLINTVIECHPSASARGIEQSKIERMLVDWHAMQDKEPFMCYALQHRYLSDNLQLDSLKGDDHYRCSQLDRACQSNGRFCIFLSRLELTDSVIDDGSDKQAVEGDGLRLNGVFTLQGLKLQDSFLISHSHLAQRNLYEARDCDDVQRRTYETYDHTSEDLVNSAEIQQVYHDVVAVIVSRDHMTEFLLTDHDSPGGYSFFLKRLFAGLTDQNGDECQLFREMIIQTCQNHIKMCSKTGTSRWYGWDHFLRLTAIACLRIENPVAAKAAFQAMETIFHTSTFQDLGGLGFEKTRELATEAFSCIPSLHLVGRGMRAFRFGIASAVQPDAIETSEDAVCQWAVGIICKALDSIRVVSSKDARAVVQIMVTYKDERVCKSMAAFVDRFLKKVVFANTLVAEVLWYARQAQKPDFVVEYLLPPILNRAASFFRLERFSIWSSNRFPSERDPFSLLPKKDESGRIGASVVASLYRQLASHDLDKAGQLLEKIGNDTTSIYQGNLDDFIIPLLVEMIDITEHQPYEASLFYAKAISTYTERMVKKEPPKPQNWSLWEDFKICIRPECPHCDVRSPVRHFLSDPNQKDKAFAIPEDQCYDFKLHLPNYYKISKWRSGKDYGIRVTKTLGRWEEKHKKWQSKADHVQSALRSLPETPLRKCLGDDKYQSLMDLQIVKIPTKDIIKYSPNSA